MSAKGQTTKASIGNGSLTFRIVKPDKKLYPHYASIRDSIFSFLPGVTVNSTGTEYEFLKHDDMLDTLGTNMELEERKSLYKKLYDLIPVGYDLVDVAYEMISLFHVDQEAFMAGNDKENELMQGLMRRAYMMSALRSFAWTLADFCNEHDTSPEDIDKSIPFQIVNFVASRDWLNYDGKTYCKGLCSGSDLHVYYLPEAVSKADKTLFLPSREDKQRVKEMKEENPSYYEILSEVHSLEELRKDLEYIFPAVKILYDDLKESRDTSEALEGNEADIVYAWIALAIAADDPFFTEDGPMNYTFSWSDKDEINNWIENQRKQRTSCAEDPVETWINKYKQYIEDDPVIEFNESKFVFSGLAAIHENEKNDPIVQKVIEKGGQYRSKVSGLTNYLVVDPLYSGESKIDAALEQQQQGKSIKIILLDDLKKALEGNAPVVSKSKSSLPKDTKTRDASAFKGTRVSREDCEIDESGTLIKYHGNADSIILPDGITAIGDDAFFESNIISVLIPEGVEKIGSQAFCLCENLKTVILPGSIRKLGEWAFYKAALTSIVIPDGCGEIGEGCFLNCSKLDDIYVPDSVFEIGEDAFHTFNIVTTIHTPEGSAAHKLAQKYDLPVDHRPTSAKATVSSKKKPSGPTKVSRQSCEIDESGTLIKYHGNADAIILPDGITAIGDEAFSEYNIISVLIPEGVEEIGAGAFDDCEELRNVTLPGSLRKLGEKAFCWTALTSVVIPDSVEEIGDEAFQFCESLKKVTLPGSIRKLGKEAFYGTALTSIVIPDGCVEIGYGCFLKCSKLDDIYVPDSVFEIGKDAFHTFNTVTTIHTPEGSAAHKLAQKYDLPVDHRPASAKATVSSKKKPSGPTKVSRQACEIDESGTLTMYRGNADAIILPDGITVIGEDAFFHDDHITEVVIPEGVEEIGDGAFQSCESLKKVTLPGTIRKLGEKAFWGTALTSVVIPDSVEEIGDEAFRFCKSLKKVTLPGTIRKLGKSAFSRTALTSIVIPDGCEEIGVDCFNFCDELNDIYVPASVFKIGYDAFSTYNTETIIHTPEGSAAHKYALENDLNVDHKPVPAKATVLPKKKQADPTKGTRSDASSLSKDIDVTVDNTWIVTVPAGFKYSTDKSIIGNHRNIIILEDKNRNSFDDPFGASVSFTSMCQETSDPVSMAKMMTYFTEGIGEKTTIKDSDDLFICYYLSERGEMLDVYKIEIGCGCELSSIQVFFYNSGYSEDEEIELIERVLTSIKLNKGTWDPDLSVEDNKSISEVSETLSNLEEEVLKGKAAIDKYSAYLEQKNVREKAYEEEINRRKAEAEAFGKSEKDIVKFYIILTNEQKIGKLSRKQDEFCEIYEEELVAFSKEEIIQTRREMVAKMDNADFREYYAERFRKMSIEDRFAISTRSLFNASDEPDIEKKSDFAIEKTKEWFKQDEYSEVRRMMAAELTDIRKQLSDQLKAVEQGFVSFSTAVNFLQLVITRKRSDDSDLKKHCNRFQIIAGSDLISVKLSTKGSFEISTTVMDVNPWFWGVTVRDIWEAAFKNEIRDERVDASDTDNTAELAMSRIRSKYPDVKAASVYSSSERGTRNNQWSKQGDQIKKQTKSVPPSDSIDSKSQQPEKKEGCYIATAVYGSYDAPQVMTLRRYRDETLRKTVLGRWFIKTYYKLSPPIAEKLKDSKCINHFVRSILDLFVNRLNKHLR